MGDAFSDDRAHWRATGAHARDAARLAASRRCTGYGNRGYIAFAIAQTALDGDGESPPVGLTFDQETATKLVDLFDALGSWLTDGGLASCQIGFGDRSYTLLAASASEPNDATAFLLERTIQLQHALDSRIVIEQAKGILAERHQVTPTHAFEACGGTPEAAE